MSNSSLVTIGQFILEQERMHREATGELTNLLYDIALAAKVISGLVRRAGLVDVLGVAGHTNVQGLAETVHDAVFGVERGLCPEPSASSPRGQQPRLSKTETDSHNRAL